MSNLKSRKTTLLRDAVLDTHKLLGKTFIKNPEYKEEHEMHKRAIIGHKKECFVCRISNKDTPLGKSAKGDHLFEIRGYYAQTGMYGIDDKWNVLPVCVKHNVKYKKIKNKNIGYEKLSDEELDTCTNKQKTVYFKIQRWLEYTQDNNVKLAIKYPPNVEYEIEKVGILHANNANSFYSNLMKII